MHHGELDRAHLEHLGAERGHLQHLLVGNLVQAPGLGHDARIGGVDAVHVRVDVAALGLDGGGERHGAGVRAAAAERRDAARRLVHALEAGDDGDFPVVGEALGDPGAVDGRDAGRAVGLRGHDRDLPALPGPGLEAHFLQREGEEARGHLLAGGDDHVVFLRIVEGRGFLDPADELVGLAGHGGDHDGDVVAGLDLAFDMPRHVADALDGGDGCAAELHDKTGHGRRRAVDGWEICPFAARKGAYT